MILYHGTTYNRFMKIVVDKKIDVCSDENSHFPNSGYCKTTRGYVYLTDNPLSALEFASKCWTNDNKDSGIRLLSVIKVDLQDEVVEDDIDEIRHNSSTIKSTKCYRVKASIPITSFVETAFFQFESFNSCCNYIENKDYDAIIWSNNKNQEWNGDIHIL